LKTTKQMKTHTESQEDLILEHLQNGRSLTQYQALVSFNCFRLSSRINRLRNRGYNIKTEMVELDNHKRIARYSLEKEPELQL